MNFYEHRVLSGDGQVEYYDHCRCMGDGLLDGAAHTRTLLAARYVQMKKCCGSIRFAPL